MRMTMCISFHVNLFLKNTLSLKEMNPSKNINHTNLEHFNIQLLKTKKYNIQNKITHKYIYKVAMLAYLILSSTESGMHFRLS